LTGLLVGLFFGVLIGYVVISLWHRKRVERYFAHTEYWVYMPGEKLPSQDDTMKLVLKAGAIGPREGLVFSDIRLHVALVLRSKNTNVFRPDLFEDHIEPTREILEALGGAKSLAKVRFISEEPLADDRHLRLLPYLAYAYARVGNGLAVYDVTAERLMTVAELEAMLKADPNAERADVHLRTLWIRGGVTGHAETRGLIKKGLPELVTEEMEPDEEVLVKSVLDEAARTLWETGALPENVDVTTFADTFRIVLSKPKEGRSSVKIMRVRTA
jgi:hypothetical protein